MKRANVEQDVHLKVASDDELAYRRDVWTNREVDLKVKSNDPKLPAKIRAAASQLRPWASANRLQTTNEEEYRVLGTRIARASALGVSVSWLQILQPVVNVHNMRLRTVQSAREASNLKIQEFLDCKAGHFQKMIALVAGVSATCE